MHLVEKVKIESVYEYISWLYRLGKISRDGAVWMLRTYADTSQYHNTIGREVNLRWNDDTGLKFAADKLKIIRRLVGPDGDSKVDEINQKNLAFGLMSHLMMLTPGLLLPAFGKRIKVIEMVRHPLYMLDHFNAYLSRFESPREFTMAFYYNDIKIPWFVSGWEDEFLNANPTERAVLSIIRLYRWLDEQVTQAKVDGLSVLDISFEQTVFETDKILARLENFTGRKHHPKIGSILKRQKLPRETIAQGRGHSSYGWVKSDSTEEEAYLGYFRSIHSTCSPIIVKDFKELIHWYNAKYPSKLAQFEGS
jgi:hypothetical protein